MFQGLVKVADGVVRYQYQTWGGTRRAESRITEGIRPLRIRAGEGDLLLFQRRADALDRFRLILLKRESTEYHEIAPFCSGRRWGLLLINNPPVNQSQLSKVGAELAKLSMEPFKLLQSRIERTESRQNRIARSLIFRERVRSEYQFQCAVSGLALATPTRLFEVEAAHVVPISEGGSDDVRNGIALTQSVHWAFDHGLFGIRADRTVHVPSGIKSMAGNEFLSKYHGKTIIEAKTAARRVHSAALEWHMEHLVRRWE
jgi:putative restriction endonuclease